MFLSEKNTPRWIIFLIDIFICLFSIYLAYLLRFNFSIPENEISGFKIAFVLIPSVRILSFYFFKTYAGIIRYTSTKDAQRIFYTISICIFSCSYAFGAFPGKHQRADDNAYQYRERQVVQQYGYERYYNSRKNITLRHLVDDAEAAPLKRAYGYHHHYPR